MLGQIGRALLNQLLHHDGLQLGDDGRQVGRRIGAAIGGRSDDLTGLKGTFRRRHSSHDSSNPYFFFEKNENFFFADLPEAASAMIRLAIDLKPDVILLPDAAATMGLPALAAAWLAFGSSTIITLIGLPRAFSNSALDTVASLPPSRLATKI